MKIRSQDKWFCGQKPNLKAVLALLRVTHACAYARDACAHLSGEFLTHKGGSMCYPIPWVCMLRICDSALQCDNVSR